jgi:hypothetical protein
LFCTGSADWRDFHHADFWSDPINDPYNLKGQNQEKWPWKLTNRLNHHGPPFSVLKRWDFQPHENTERAWKVVTWSFYQSPGVLTSNLKGSLQLVPKMGIPVWIMQILPLVSLKNP